MSQVISDFISAYTREYDFYQSASGICSLRCEQLLATQGIRAIVSHRAKRPNKLQAKLLQRNKEKNYASSEEIRADIPDLAGVRIALYFPADREKVKAILNDNFDLLKAKNFPERTKPRNNAKRFDGYHADHYRVLMHEIGLEEGEKSYAAAPIEIQVGSVLMHAWAEVEHDLVYKPESGTPSEDEHAILDELNGMVIAGEIALERLQKAVERRLTNAQGAPFDNHYELAAFIHKWMQGNLLDGAKPPIGRVDIVWELLKRADLNSPEKVMTLLPEAATVAAASAAPLSDKLADALLALHPELYSAYGTLQSSLTATEVSPQQTPESAARTDNMGDFLSAWITLERTFRILGADVNSKKGGYIDPLKGAKSMELSPGTIETIVGIRRLRNNLVHGIEIPSRKKLAEAKIALDSVFFELQNHPEQRVREALAEAKDPSTRP
ncbi:RelA/SpoT domain-containing protein [Mesorhizobium sp. AR10]|uniref:GTP pyrophosphokinase n=1 Tax=Mesorhizobium sp. AR10 TaxID=2865839 RepID=UPI0021600891|nr:RelA/SpoT domain-containing protein [Mesorhizobium sp. AR10]UVK39383.1 RelA/SpoT domain-containing protein [Mesorhizobium sp. AR10]